MSPSQRKTLIRKDHTALSLTRQCKLLKISRSSLYYTPVGINAETLKLMNEIDRVFTKYPFFGSRQIAAYLPRNGFHAGRHRVRRLMGIMGLQAIHRPAVHCQMHERGQRTQHQQKAPSAPDLPLFAEKVANQARQPCLVQRHNLYPGAARLPLSGRNHGLGNPQGLVLAAVQYALLSVIVPITCRSRDARFCVEALNEAIAKYGKPEIRRLQVS